MKFYVFKLQREINLVHWATFPNSPLRKSPVPRITT